MKNDITLDSLAKPIVSFFRRFHTIIFFLLVSGGLFAAIVMLLSIISLSSGRADTADNAISGAFDKGTIRLLEDKNNATEPPSGRKSPFVE